MEQKDRKRVQLCVRRSAVRQKTITNVFHYGENHVEEWSKKPKTHAHVRRIILTVQAAIPSKRCSNHLRISINPVIFNKMRPSLKMFCSINFNINRPGIVYEEAIPDPGLRFSKKLFWPYYYFLLLAISKKKSKERIEAKLKLHHRNLVLFCWVSGRFGVLSICAPCTMNHNLIRNSYCSGEDCFTCPKTWYQGRSKRQMFCHWTITNFPLWTAIIWQHPKISIDPSIPTPLPPSTFHFPLSTLHLPPSTFHLPTSSGPLPPSHYRHCHHGKAIATSVTTSVVIATAVVITSIATSAIAVTVNGNGNADIDTYIISTTTVDMKTSSNDATNTACEKISTTTARMDRLRSLLLQPSFSTPTRLR